MSRIKFESEILDAAKRKQIIQEIMNTENLRRKDEAYRRYLCYKDQTNRFVVEHLLRQFDMNTVSEMRYSIANISVIKKIIDKLARVYSSGVDRTVSEDESTTNIVKSIGKILKLDSEMKKTNRLLKLHKNVAFYVKPCPVYNYDGTEVKWTIQLEALSPHHYDVIEDFYDRTKPLCYILSDYKAVIQDFTSLDVGIRPLAPTLVPKGDGRDQTIADTPEDENLDMGKKRQFIFWSKNYHFTCDETGEIVADENNPNNENPFKVPMIVNFAVDQDNSFWAQGGEDLIDGGILINSMLTHLNNIGVLQSYGQFYVTGENLPREFKIGPHKALIMEYKKDEQAEPKAGFLNANPNLNDLRGCVEAFIALLLTTNNLSTSGVSTQLQTGRDMASGIALVIDKAESLEDVSDQRQIFIDGELEIWRAIAAFLTVYGPTAVDELKSLKIPDGAIEKLSTRFNDQSPIMSEKEKLDTWKARQDLGLDTTVSLLMKDDPTLTEKQAQEKLMKLIGQRIDELVAESEAKAAAGIPDPVVVLPDPDEPAQPGAIAPGQPNANSKTNNNGPGTVSNA